MIGRLKRALLILLVVSLIMPQAGLIYNLLEAAETTPLPANTEEVKRETRIMAGSEFEFSYYESALDTGQIKNFYRKALADLGWEEQNFIGMLQKVPDFKIDAKAAKNLGANLMFKRQDETLNIVFVPGKSEQGKTRFSITQGKLSAAAIQGENIDFTPKLLATPAKEVAPLYPGSSLVNLSENSTSQQAAYSSKDDIDSVASFYKSNMNRFGWRLAEEKPVRQIGAPDGSSSVDISKYCPSCAKKGQAAGVSINTLFQELVFVNEQQDKCKIGIFETEMPKETAGIAGLGKYMTTIMVDYEQKR